MNELGILFITFHRMDIDRFRCLFRKIYNNKGVFCLSLSIKELLENKGLKPRKEHLEILDTRWKGMAALRGNLDGVAIDDADIGMRNIPGGDHVE